MFINNYFTLIICYRKLKTLVINDTPNIQNKELVSLMLQDIIPSCEIIGVNFNDPVLLKTLENHISQL